MNSNDTSKKSNLSMATGLVDQLMNSNEEADLKSDPAFQQGVEEGLSQESQSESPRFKRLNLKGDSLMTSNDLKRWHRDKPKRKGDES